MQKATYLLKSKNRFNILLITGLILIPVIIYCVPLEWVKSQHTICLYKNITGHECYGCGMTRAIFSALHMKFLDAIHYNRLCIVVLPILIYIWFKTILSLLPADWIDKKLIRKFRTEKT